MFIQIQNQLISTDVIRRIIKSPARADCDRFYLHIEFRATTHVETHFPYPTEHERDFAWGTIIAELQRAQLLR